MYLTTRQILRSFSRVVVPIKTNLNITKKKHPDLNQLKKQLYQQKQRKNKQAEVLYEEAPFSEVYKRMDTSIAAFFAKREYTLENFNFLLMLLGEKGQSQKIPEVLDKIRLLNLQPNEDSYNYMVRAAGKSGDIAIAEEYFNIGKTKFGVNKHMYTSLMLAYVLQKDCLMADRILFEMERNGLVPDLPVYTTLINAHLKSRNLPRCWALHKQVVQKHKLALDEPHTAVMMQVYASSHDSQKAIKLWRQNIEQNQIRPTLETVNSYIKALSSRYEYADKAISFFFHIVGTGTLINAKTVLYTLRACSQNGSIKSASEILKVMKLKGIEPDQFIYNALLRVYSGAVTVPELSAETVDMMITDAWKIFSDIVKSGFLDTTLLNNFLEIFVLSLRTQEAQGLVLPMYDKYGLKKDQYTYENLLKMSSKTQDLMTFQRVWKVQLDTLNKNKSDFIAQYPNGKQLAELPMHTEKFRPTFNALDMYLQLGIKLQDMNVVIDALKMFQQMKRMPKTKHLQFLGQLQGVPVEIKEELTKFDLVFKRKGEGDKFSKHKIQHSIKDPQNQ